jgi:hypothetical protein
MSVRQSPSFENPKYHNRVYNLSMVLYRLKQASWTWYATLKTFLLDHGYVMGSVGKTLFTLNHDTDFYLFKLTWMISSLVALLTLLYLDFRK